VRVWDATTGEVLASLEGHTHAVYSVAFSPDGGRIASGSHDDTVRVWDATTGEVIATLEGHTDWVKSVAFSPDGGRIASGSDDSTVRVWDATIGEVLATLEGHTDSVKSVAFSPDSSRLISRNWHDIQELWDTATWTLVQNPDEYPQTSITELGCFHFRYDSASGWLYLATTNTNASVRLCWVPASRRGGGAQSWSFGSKVVLSSGNGIITILDFSSHPLFVAQTLSHCQ
jgi:WD40 repeat protein